LAASPSGVLHTLHKKLEFENAGNDRHKNLILI
jgi:hypothetical protein